MENKKIYFYKYSIIKCSELERQNKVNTFESKKCNFSVMQQFARYFHNFEWINAKVPSTFISISTMKLYPAANLSSSHMRMKFHIHELNDVTRRKNVNFNAQLQQPRKSTSKSNEFLINSRQGHIFIMCSNEYIVPKIRIIWIAILMRKVPLFRR